jgi:hypothetical protein
MTDSLVAIPATVLEPDGLDALASCVRALGDGRVVLVGAQRGSSGEVLDEFVVTAAVAARSPGSRVGVVARVGQGRAASVIAREATAAQLLGACEVLLLEGAAERCEDAARVITALCTPGTHTLRAGDEHVVDAPNLPQPSQPGRPAVRWRDGAALRGLVDGVPCDLGSVVDISDLDGLPAAHRGTLVVLDAPLAPAPRLAALLAR